MEGAVSGTWTLAGSPYFVIGDVQIDTLTVEAGVLVFALPAVELVVSGSLVTAGTPLAPVVFTALRPGRWGGIEILDASGASSLEHTRIQRSGDSGLRIVHSQVSLASCELVDNVSATDGGGIRAELAGENLLLDRCTIAGNSAVQDGGGIRADMSGGVLTLDLCVVSGNQAEDLDFGTAVRGGGIFVQGAADVRLTDTVIDENSTTAVCDCTIVFASFGGGICLQDAPATLTRCIVRGNRSLGVGSFFDHASVEGAGIRFEGANLTLALRNVILTENESWSEAKFQDSVAAVFCLGSTLLVTNSTIARNRAVEGHVVSPGPTVIYKGAGIVVSTTGVAEVRNSVLYDNTTCISLVNPLVSSECGPETFGDPLTGLGFVSYSDVEGINVEPGIGNVKVPPNFAGHGASYADLSIAPSSPCVDAGNPAPVFADTSFPPSLGGTRNDMGHNGGIFAGGWLAWSP